MKAARLLVRALAEPESVGALDDSEWEALLTAARAERLIGSLAFRLEAIDVPAKVRLLLADVRRDSDQEQVQAFWEAEMARRALAPLDVPVILLKGTAYLAADLDVGVGRSVGDLDILVPRDRLDAVQEALLAAGWEWVKEDAYDDLYYRQWMHELPPLIHNERDRMADVHHTILPPTARPKPDAAALVADSIPLASGLRTLSPQDMVVHAAAHLIADGDLAGGLRNLWDIDRLCREFETRQEDFYLSLYEQSHSHGLLAEVLRALRLAQQIFGTPAKGYRAPLRVVLDKKPSDSWFRRRLLARDGWGRERQPLTRFGFYVRSHWMRMPPMMLARHLLVKARR